MRSKFYVLLALILAAAMLASCAGTQEAAPAGEQSAPEAAVEEAAPAQEEESGEPAAEEQAALVVGGVEFTLSQLEGMPALEVEYTNKDGEVTVYTGVLVTDLLAEAGLDGATAVFAASDGYEAEVALAEVQTCADCVVAFDDGELRMVLPGFPSNLQVKGVVEIQVIGEAEPMEETALLVGEMGYTMSQLEGMETIAVEYTGKDDVVTTYSGVPLADLLAGAELEGETVVLIASDGYEAEVALADVLACADCVVAFDGTELRSVLPDFSSKAQVKGLVEIQIR